MNARFHASRVGQGMCVVSGEREAHADSVEDLREALSAAVAGGCKRVLVDLQDSEHVDPLILGAILGSQRRLSHFGGQIAVLCCSESGYADLERGGITRQMDAFEERQRAFDWLGQGVKEIPGNAR
ncbi:MAG TPA: STAS domain-containing protein [Thermoleophilaceae bacterium]|jgi:anti-anti-sigma regulatory factor|nr:STAS domain-containing protein [Thermoleophilaceae bacterium]